MVRRRNGEAGTWQEGSGMKYLTFKTGLIHEFCIEMIKALVSKFSQNRKGIAISCYNSLYFRFPLQYFVSKFIKSTTISRLGFLALKAAPPQSPKGWGTRERGQGERCPEKHMDRGKLPSFRARTKPPVSPASLSLHHSCVNCLN